MQDKITRLKTTLVRTELREQTTLMRMNAFFRVGGIGTGLKTAEAKAWNQLKRDIGAGSRTQWRSVVDDLCSTTAYVSMESD